MIIAEHLRLAAVAAALFVLSYSGVAWAIAGAPVPAFSAVWQNSGHRMPDTRMVSLPAPQSDAGKQNSDAQDAAVPPRDRLRLAAYEASTAYARSPCDKAVKARLVAAVGAYAQAWRDMMGCDQSGCDRHKLDAASAAFSTPLDMQVRAAVTAAFDKRGVSVDDFPAPLRIHIATLARGSGDPVPVCPSSAAR